MNWVFILVALGAQHGAIAESVNLDSREQCLSYARGRLGTLPPAHTALCVDRRAGEIIDLRQRAQRKAGVVAALTSAAEPNS